MEAGGRLYFLLAGVDAGALVVTGLGLAGGAAGLGATGVTALSRPEAATPEVDVGTAVGTAADAVATVADATGTYRMICTPKCGNPKPI